MVASGHVNQRGRHAIEAVALPDSQPSGMLFRTPRVVAILETTSACDLQMSELYGLLLADTDPSDRLASLHGVGKKKMGVPTSKTVLVAIERYWGLPKAAKEAIAGLLVADEENRATKPSQVGKAFENLPGPGGTSSIA
jgi:site-specific recombinase XerC